MLPTSPLLLASRAACICRTRLQKQLLEKLLFKGSKNPQKLHIHSVLLTSDDHCLSSNQSTYKARIFTLIHSFIDFGSWKHDCPVPRGKVVHNHRHTCSKGSCLPRVSQRAKEGREGTLARGHAFSGEITSGCQTLLKASPLWWIRLCCDQIDLVCFLV